MPCTACCMSISCYMPCCCPCCMLTHRLNMAHVQDGSSKVGLERILTPISSLAGWVMVVAGVLSSVQVGLGRLTAMLLSMLHAPCHSEFGKTHMHIM